MSNLIQSLEAMAQEVIQREGFELYDIEFQSSQRKLIVTIDKENGNVSVDDCALISRGLNLLLDSEDIIPGENYDLEVSSPGLERPLKKLWHYQKALGEKAQVSIKAGVDTQSFAGLRSLKACIEAVEKEKIKFNKIENSKLESVEIPFDSIHKAHLVFEYGRNIQVQKSNKSKKSKK